MPTLGMESALAPVPGQELCLAPCSRRWSSASRGRAPTRRPRRCRCAAWTPRYTTASGSLLNCGHAVVRSPPPRAPTPACRAFQGFEPGYWGLFGDFELWVLLRGLDAALYYRAGSLLNCGHAVVRSPPPPPPVLPIPLRFLGKRVAVQAFRALALGDIGFRV